MLSETYHLKTQIQQLEAENQSLRAEIETLRDARRDHSQRADTKAELQPATPSWQEKALIILVRQWLGEKGIEAFRDIRDHHVRTIQEVHFREGTLVRNYLRGITNGAWSDWEYDDHWEEIVLEAIR